MVAQPVMAVIKERAAPDEEKNLRQPKANNFKEAKWKTRKESKPR